MLLFDKSSFIKCVRFISPVISSIDSMLYFHPKGNPLVSSSKSDRFNSVTTPNSSLISNDKY